MNSADSAVRGALLQLTSPEMLAALVAALCAVMVAYTVARVLGARRVRTAPDLPLPEHGLDHALEGMVILAPILAALATLLAAHVLIGALGISTVPSTPPRASLPHWCWCGSGCSCWVCCSGRARGCAPAARKLRSSCG